MSQREIAATLKLSKSTVNKYLRINTFEIAEKLPVRKRSSQFDIAHDFILQQLEQMPNMRASDLFCLVKDKYPQIRCKSRAFRNYIARIRQQEQSQNLQGQIFISAPKI